MTYIEIGSHKQIFLDRRFVDQSEGIQIKVNPPLEQREVLRGDRPWDRGWIGWLTVLEDEGVYKMWYLAAPESTVEEVDSGRAFRLCYAVSEDGINWEKPELGLVEYEGNKRNNIVHIEGFPGGSPEGSVLLDPQAPPEQRYKMLAIRSSAAITGKPDQENDGVYLAYSSDGINWQMYEKRLLPFLPDTQNQVLYDPDSGKYIAYLRAWAPLRKVARVEIENLLEPWGYDRSVTNLMLWGKDSLPPPGYEFPIAFSYDGFDPPETDIYNPAVSRYPWAQNVWYAFPSVYRHFPEPPLGPCVNDGLLEIQVAVSRDGGRFWRPDRSPYIPLGVEGSHHAGQMYMGPGMIRRGDRLFQYYNAFDVSHSGYRCPKPLPIVDMSRVFVAVQLLDRFIGVQAPDEGGWLLTPPLRFAGKELELNIDCGATGEAQVELCDEGGLPIEGFSLDESDLVRGNHLRKKVSWRNGKTDVSALVGRPVHLRIRMRNARLYAFQFLSEPEGVEGGIGQ